MASTTLETMPFLDSFFPSLAAVAVIFRKFSLDNLSWTSDIWKQK